MGYGGFQLKSAALPAWRYRNPEMICDGLIAESKRIAKEAARQEEIRRKHKSRRIKALTKRVIKNGGTAA